MRGESKPLIVYDDRRARRSLIDCRSLRLPQGSTLNLFVFGLVAGLLFTHVEDTHRERVSRVLEMRTAIFASAPLTGVTSDLTTATTTTVAATTTTEKPAEINLAELLSKEVRVLCVMVPTSARTMRSDLQILLSTWTKRCTKFVMFVTEFDENFKDRVVVLRSKDNYWMQLREALEYVHKTFRDQYDWVLRTNDNSYVVMENLRWLLYQYNASWPLVFGQRFLPDGHVDGVYALSKDALDRIVARGFVNNGLCPLQIMPDEPNDDRTLCKCLQRLNIRIIDTVDDDDREMFFKRDLETPLFPAIDPNFDRDHWHKVRWGRDKCCSDRLIALQSVTNVHHFYLEYFIYKVFTFGRYRLPEPLPERKRFEDVMLAMT